MEQPALVEIGLPIALFIIMVGIGLTLTTGDFRREAKAPRGAVVGTAAQLIVMPLVGFAVAAALGLSPALAVGLVILAACAGGTTSNLVTYLAKGNVALSVALTVIGSVGSIVTIPVAANLALRWQSASSDEAVRVPVGPTVGLLVLVVLVPIVIGMAIRHRAPARAAALERGMAVFGGAVLVFVIFLLALSLGGDLPGMLRDAGPAVILLNLVGLAVGAGLAALARLPVADRIACAVELGIKNVTVAILIAMTVIGSDETAIPAGTYGLLMYGSAFAVVAYGRRRQRRLRSQPQPSDPTPSPQLASTTVS